MNETFAEYSWMCPTLERQYGEVIGRTIYEALIDAIDTTKDHCIDNFRFANKENSNEVEQYEKKKESGCCGFIDKEIEINGETFLYGFNYGH